MTADLWYIPISQDQVLIYAPFHGITTLVNRALAEHLPAWLDGTSSEPLQKNTEWIRTLQGSGVRPQRHFNDMDPLFLGLIPTRGCMMQCAYCDFHALRAAHSMSFETIRRAIDGYASLLQGTSAAEWNIHFFGGEPFAAFKEVVYAVNYARRKAERLGISTHLEVTTNGFYPEDKAHWIFQYFDTVVLSLDGFPEAQNRHRPGPGGRTSFETVCRSADIFSRGDCELIIRSCVSAENVREMADWAEFIAERWSPEAVCLEPLIESSLALQNGLHAPDPKAFISSWITAAEVLKRKRIRLVYSSGEITELKNSLCPMGRDAVIVSPDGQIGSCWQLAENQQAEGFDLNYGTVTDTGLEIDSTRLEKQRNLSENNRENCRGCFCYAHCAGGCVLNHERSGDFCRMTKALTLWQLMDRLGYGQAAKDLLGQENYLQFLSITADFRVLSAGLPGPDQNFRESAAQALNTNFEPGDSMRFPAIPGDAERGWLRDGQKILVIDPVRKDIAEISGIEALRFQLDHCGLPPADADAVWAALLTEEI